MFSTISKDISSIWSGGAGARTIRLLKKTNPKLSSYTNQEKDRIAASSVWEIIALYNFLSFFSGCLEAFQVRVQKLEPPCLCSATPTTLSLIHQAKSSSQWVHLCTWASLWRTQTQFWQLFWRTATPLTHQTLMIPHNILSSRTSMCISPTSPMLCEIQWSVWTLLISSLLSHRCPTDRLKVSIVESGSSLRARFSALLFLLQGEYRDIYLHCSLSLCNQRKYNCVPVSSTFHFSSTP